ncbi:uncharacterized protein AB675_3963 [Cyphellophora attinorum]|uniref:Uncharacterized protein n=1 Tax=Cyphellophora attinorum TaxID=1664694 RepID=A0A0N1H677_9EURO|nr:uncharacterized protein AB675_3963 [Phialophora attinorum]KPI37547.1 hypothetical protein AB675_3963 [Phialophora attinorum]
MHETAARAVGADAAAHHPCRHFVLLSSQYFEMMVFWNFKMDVLSKINHAIYAKRALWDQPPAGELQFVRHQPLGITFVRNPAKLAMESLIRGAVNIPAVNHVELIMAMFAKGHFSASAAEQ